MRELEPSQIHFHRPHAIDLAKNLKGDVFLELVSDTSGDTDDAAARVHAELATLERVMHGQLALRRTSDVDVVMLGDLNEVGDALVSKSLRDARDVFRLSTAGRSSANDEHAGDLVNLETINQNPRAPKLLSPIHRVRTRRRRDRLEKHHESRESQDAYD